MFVYLVAIVVIICTIFGLTYSQTSLRDISDGGASSSTIQLPAFSHSVPLIGQPRAGVDGDNGIVVESSQQSLELPFDPFYEAALRAPWFTPEEEAENARRAADLRFEEAARVPWDVEESKDESKDERRRLENRIIDEKIRDANQLGIAESLWQPAPISGNEKIMKDIINKKCASDGAKSAPQKVNTNTIFNMIQYETFKEAMAVLHKQQQEQEEAAKAAAAGARTTENNEEAFADDEQKENFPVRGAN